MRREDFVTGTLIFFTQGVPSLAGRGEGATRRFVFSPRRPFSVSPRRFGQRTNAKGDNSGYYYISWTDVTIRLSLM